jgi:hypothetical protein
MTWENKSITIDGIEVSKHVYRLCVGRYYRKRDIDAIQEVLNEREIDIDAEQMVAKIKERTASKNKKEQSEREKELDPTIGDSNVDNSLDISAYR